MASKLSEVTLVDALLAARILIARTDADGRPTVRLAHDAVLASWPRASEAAQASREFYRVRAEVEDALRRWQEHGRPKDRLIQPGVPLAEAEKLVADFGAELPVELTSFVTASRNRARRRQRFERAAAVFFFALAAAATGASVWACVERDRSKQALATITQTGNTLVYDLAPSFFVRGLPTDLLELLLDRAIQGYDQAIQRNPKNAFLYVNRGFAYVIKGDHDRAIQDYNQGLQLDSKNALAYRSRALAYGSKGDHDRAIQDYDKAIQLDPKDALAYGGRADAYRSKGDYDRAIQDHDQAIQLDPNNSAAYVNRGVAYKSKGDYDRAIQDYDQAIELTPTLPSPTPTEATPTEARTNTTARSRITTRRSYSIRKIQNMSKPMSAVGSSIRPRATTTVPFKTTIRRSSSHRRLPSPTPAAPTPTGARATTTAQSRTTIRRSSSIQKFRRLQEPRLRARQQGRLRPRDPGLRLGDSTRSEKCRRPQEQRLRLLLPRQF